MHICATLCDRHYLPHTTFRFFIINFQQISLSNFAFFTVKSLTVILVEDRFLKKENTFN